MMNGRGRGHAEWPSPSSCRCASRSTSTPPAMTKYAVPHAHDLDLGAIEPRQHRPGDDLVDRAEHRRAGAEIEHAVDRVDERVELVGAEQDRDLEFVAQPARDLDDARLMRGIERDQRLVEQQQLRLAEQRLAEQQRAGARRPRVRRSSGARDRARRPDRAPSRSRAASPRRAAKSRSARPSAALATTS